MISRVRGSLALPFVAIRVFYRAMSFLDDHKRAKKGAKALVKMLVGRGRFDEHLDAYTAADGIIDEDFLRQLEIAKPLLKRVDHAEFAAELEAVPLAFQEAILEFLREQGRFDRLKEIAENSPSKALSKSAKQHLHAAKSAGVIKTETPAASWTLKPRDTREPLQCAATAYDSSGDRIVLFASDHNSGIRILQVVENDRTGVTHHVFGTQTRSKYRELLKGLREIGPDHYREIAPAEALWLIDRARRRHERDRTSPPSGFITAFSTVSDRIALPERHPFVNTVRPIELEHQENRVSESATLFEHPLTRGWTLGQAELRRFQSRVGEIVKSREELWTPSNKDRVLELIDETVDAFFNQRTREAFADRLMDMAWYCVSARRDTALLAYGTAVALRNPSKDVRGVPFCRMLLARYVPGYAELGKTTAKPAIIAP